jgi:hypothetical protein
MPSPNMLTTSEGLAMSHPRGIIAVILVCVAAPFSTGAPYAQKHACTPLESQHALAKRMRFEVGMRSTSHT